jgi:small subunit ribosomal protein S11
MAQKKTDTKKKKKISIDRGVVHIQSTYNNTIVTISDTNGNTIAWSSGGTVGYSGSKKSTPYAAQLAADQVGKEVMKYGLKKVDVVIKGPGPGREAVIRTLQAAGLEVGTIKDSTPVPHNGCRPKKRRGLQ